MSGLKVTYLTYRWMHAADLRHSRRVVRNRPPLQANLAAGRATQFHRATAGGATRTQLRPAALATYNALSAA